MIFNLLPFSLNNFCGNGNGVVIKGVVACIKDFWNRNWLQEWYDLRKNFDDIQQFFRKPKFPSI